MRKWIDAILLLVLVAVVAAAGATAWPAVTDGDDVLRGQTLRNHMMVGGVLVVGLPVIALWFLGRVAAGGFLGGVGRTGYWLLLLCGWVTIASVYVCMVPVASTDQMHELIELHGWAGWATAVAAVVLAVGWLLSLRRKPVAPPSATKTGEPTPTAPSTTN